MSESTATGSSNNKRKTTTPPDGYVCNVCQVAGHWIQQCPSKKKKKTSNHVPVAGVDPSQQDIQRARELQKITPPNCFCGMPSRLKKVKRSKATQDSRAIGKYFFFCPKLKLDDTKCRFARPVEDELKPKKERLCTFFIKNGTCKKGEKCMFSHEMTGKETVEQAETKGQDAAETIDRDTDDSDSSSDSDSGTSSDSSSDGDAGTSSGSGNNDDQ